MKQNKADLLNEKIETQNKLLKSQLVIVKNVDARIEAIKNLLVVKGVITEDEYQRSVDAQLGLKRKEGEEKIENGDIVWVSYVASDSEDLANQTIEKGIPLRIGSGAIPFEHELLGQNCNLKGHKFELPYEGRKLLFLVDVLMVKTKVGVNSALDELEG